MSLYGADAIISGKVNINTTTPGPGYVTSTTSGYLPASNGTVTNSASLTLSDSTLNSNLPFLSILGGGGAGNTVGLNLSPYGARATPSISIRGIDNGNGAGDLAFWTANTGSTTTQTEKMRLFAGGALSLGTTSNNALFQSKTQGTDWAFLSGPIQTWSNDDSINKMSGVANAATVLGLYHASTVSNQTYIRFMSGNNMIGGISCNAGGTSMSLTSTSDERLKENIVTTDAETAGQVIDSLDVRNFNWKSTGQSDIGFIAQEVASVVPECVQIPRNPDEMWTMSFTQLIPYMLRTIQDLRARVAQLENK